MSYIDRLRPGYHNLLRREILNLIPTTVKHVLDLGCGTGELGNALKKRQPCHVTGIEINKEALQIAKSKLDITVLDNLNRYNPAFSNRHYDCLVFADILEHLINPWPVLKKFVSVLSDDGVVVASIPNIAHPHIISQLRRGLLRYRQAGLLDITHLRFFTKTTIGQLFYKAGLKIVKIAGYPSEDNPIQYHVTAIKPVVEHKKPTTTILILTYNGWDTTRQCIESIKQRTLEPHKILVIDNGSTDTTLNELRADLQIYHIENSCNLGFGTGFNIGMECVDTPYFVICNSDTVVTQGWLTRMINAMSKNDKIMLLGPVTNNVSGPQRLLNTKYKTAEELETFAEKRLEYNPMELIYHKRIIFFFALLRTEIIGKIGLIDERFETGNYEDDDYCMRIHQAGYETAYTDKVFIHHYGSTTFKKNKLNFAKLMAENQKKFLTKWGMKSMTDYSEYINSRGPLENKKPKV